MTPRFWHVGRVWVSWSGRVQMVRGYERRVVPHVYRWGLLWSWGGISLVDR